MGSKTPQLVAELLLAANAHVVTFLWIGMSRNIVESTFWRLKLDEHLKDALVKELDFSLQHIVQKQGGCEVKKMLVTPSASRMLGDLLFAFLAA